MAGRQEELRALMKATKHKTSKQQIKQLAATRTKSPNSYDPSPVAAAKADLPVGFFDDSVEDAKARKVDLKQLVDKQMEDDWAAFQEFAAEVEQQDKKAQEEQVEERKERDAVEQLENMEYVDRYRKVLERATERNHSQKAGMSARSSKRSLQDTATEEVNELSDVEATTVPASVVVMPKPKRKKTKRQQDEDDDDEDFDPTNWRSRAF